MCFRKEHMASDWLQDEDTESAWPDLCLRWLEVNFK